MWLHASFLKIVSIQWICIWFSIGFSSLCRADVLLNTDDTDIVAKQHCQFESAMVSPVSDSTNYQLNTACQWIDGLETSLLYGQNSSYAKNHQWAAQFKGVIKPLDRWGMAASVMLSQHREEDQKYLEWWLNIPLSLEILNNSLYLYSNLGYQHTEGLSALWRFSLASKYFITPNLSISLEGYNQDHKAPFVQSVLHYDVIPNLLAFESSLGSRLNNYRQRWFGLGLTFTP